VSSTPSGSSVSSVSSTPSALSGSQQADSLSYLESLNNPSLSEIAKILKISLPVAWEIKNILNISIPECISATKFFLKNNLIPANIVQKIFDNQSESHMNTDDLITKIKTTIINKINGKIKIDERDKKLLNIIVKLSNHKSIKLLMISKGLITEEEFEAIKKIFDKTVNEITASTVSPNGNSGPSSGPPNGNSVRPPSGPPSGNNGGPHSGPPSGNSGNSGNSGHPSGNSGNSGHPSGNSGNSGHPSGNSGNSGHPSGPTNNDNSAVPPSSNSGPPSDNSAVLANANSVSPSGNGGPNGKRGGGVVNIGGYRKIITKKSNKKRTSFLKKY
jgi:hypothetical protein